MTGAVIITGIRGIRSRADTGARYKCAQLRPGGSSRVEDTDQKRWRETRGWHRHYVFNVRPTAGIQKNGSRAAYYSPSAASTDQTRRDHLDRSNGPHQGWGSAHAQKQSCHFNL